MNHSPECGKKQKIYQIPVYLSSSIKTPPEIFSPAAFLSDKFLDQAVLGDPFFRDRRQIVEAGKNGGDLGGFFPERVIL